MAFYFVTGKLGNGKTLVSVSRIKAKLAAGLPVATNIDLDLQAMFGKMAKKLRVIRLPDKPTVSDLSAIGKGNETYDESKNGLLVLDECGTWFNSRNWQDKTRANVNAWFLHARKLGWDVILIVQDISIIDNQAREALSEFTAFCKRLDNIRLPIIGGLLQAFSIKLPKIHIARVVYGSSAADMLSDRWVYRGTDLYSAYDTKQIFLSDFPHGPHSLLPPYYLNKRTFSTRNWGFYMRMTKIYWKKFKAPLAVFSGILVGLFLAYLMTVYMNNQFYKEYQQLVDALDKVTSIEIKDESANQQSEDNSVFRLIEGYRIVGYGRYSDDVIYDLAPADKAKYSESDDSAPMPNLVRTSELGSLFVVRPMGPCHVRLMAEGTFRDVYCF